MVGNVHDVITCVKFQIEIFMGYDFTGSWIFDFPIVFLHVPYNSEARAAGDVCAHNQQAGLPLWSSRELI